MKPLLIPKDQLQKTKDFPHQDSKFQGFQLREHGTAGGVLCGASKALLWRVIWNRWCGKHEAGCCGICQQAHKPHSLQSSSKKIRQPNPVVIQHHASFFLRTVFKTAFAWHRFNTAKYNAWQLQTEIWEASQKKKKKKKPWCRMRCWLG